MADRDYSSRKPSLMRSFDKILARIRPELVARYGKPQAEQLVSESRREYASLIPEIPYIGERSIMLVFLLPASRQLALYRAMRKLSYPKEEAQQMVYRMGEEGIRAVPTVVRWVIGRIWFSRWFLRRLQMRAVESQQTAYPDGYVFHFVEGDGQTFDYGIDYKQCAACKFLESQDAFELAPVVCAVDKTASELMGWGLTRRMTLAEGHERCDFRFKKGGKTNVSLPRTLSEVVNYK